MIPYCSYYTHKPVINIFGLEQLFLSCKQFLNSYDNNLFYKDDISKPIKDTGISSL